MSCLLEKVEEYVEIQLKNYKPEKVRAPKVIHDSILGSNLFMPHEVAVFDLPLVQRLRRISQVAVASLVYPSGNHNRFEHSLGVAVIAEHLVTALFRKIEEGKANNLQPYKDVKLSKEFVLNHVRMASILHDCGHGPFSHLSEKVFKNYEDFKELVASNPILSEASAHEVLSYLIVTSKAFKTYFQREITEKYNISINLELVGQMIVGHVADPETAFIVAIINGAFDADKLDYIQRDSHFTGIKMVLDLHRLFYTIDLIRDSKGFLRLSVDLSGVSTLEQIIFNKMMLFTTVYHHHKVRAAECLFKSLIDEIKNNKINIKGVCLQNTADFLYLTDDDIYGLTNSSETIISELATDLCFRRLPKRALAVSRKTCDSKIEQLLDATQVYDKPEGVRLLQEAISEETKSLGMHIPPHEIWIDLQRGPRFKEAILCPIKSTGEENGYIMLHNVLPVDDWVRAFSEVKWSGYIFTKPEFRKIVSQSTINVFEKAFDIKFNGFSKTLCKIDKEIYDSSSLFD